MKYFVIRTDKITGEKHYMKTKTVGGWTSIKTYCWRFSKQGAKGIAKRYSEYTNPVYAKYTYGIETAES